MTLRQRARLEHGFVTAELALAMPVLMFVVIAGVWLQSAVALNARCLDAARAGARAAARGDADSTIRSGVAPVLPRDASVSIRRDAARVTVSVSARVQPPAGLAAFLGSPVITASATGVAEETDP